MAENDKIELTRATMVGKALWVCRKKNVIRLRTASKEERSEDNEDRNTKSGAYSYESFEPSTMRPRAGRVIDERHRVAPRCRIPGNLRDWCIHNSLSKVYEIVKSKWSIGTCIFATPTTKTLVTTSQWNHLPMTLTPKLFICHPKGENA
ncbi:unnamed protein product [Heligmosomoides polygyrus]|uniref:Uncharacterized protein n=1 Tax=Heligmosomoides polygyrus TaxID=6339 RepID=A0A183G9D9_HELPZ|nr:unnamed protein product [Heligmosomoides polygyrus]